VCAREKEGRLITLCLLFYELGLYVGFLLRLIVPEPASSVIPKLARTRGLGDWITAFNGQKVTQKCAVNLVM